MKKDKCYHGFTYITCTVVMKYRWRRNSSAMTRYGSHPVLHYLKQLLNRIWVWILKKVTLSRFGYHHVKKSSIKTSNLGFPGLIPGSYTGNNFSYIMLTPLPFTTTFNIIMIILIAQFLRALCYLRGDNRIKINKNKIAIVLWYDVCKRKER